MNINDKSVDGEARNETGNVTSGENGIEAGKATPDTTNKSFSESDLKRLYWHSRRGMLELDLLLVPFATDCLARLDETQLADYRTLLAEEDQDLWVWLTRREPAPSEDLRRCIDLILQHNATATR